MFPDIKYDTNYMFERSLDNDETVKECFDDRCDGQYSDDNRVMLEETDELIRAYTYKIEDNVFIGRSFYVDKNVCMNLKSYFNLELEDGNEFDEETVNYCKELLEDFTLSLNKIQ